MGSVRDDDDLVARLDSLVIEIREELEQRLADAKTALEADELFVYAGLIRAGLGSAAEYVESVRDELDRRARAR
jgi:hypothetical protein